MTAEKMTDDELRKLAIRLKVPRYMYDTDDGLAALRAVFEAGALAQRDMEPTPEMCFAGGEAIRANNGEGDQLQLRGDALAAFRAMQRAAPLAKAGKGEG